MLVAIIIFFSALGGMLFSRFFLRPAIAKLEIRKRLTILRYPDYDRELSSDELIWADRAAATIFSEVSKTHPSGRLKETALVVGFLVLMILSMLAFCGLTIEVIKHFQQDVNSSALSWYRIESVGASTIIALFAGIIVPGWLAAKFVLMLGTPHRHFKDFFKNWHDGSRSYWKSVTLDLIRKQQISPYDSEADLLFTIAGAPYQRMANVCGYWAALLLGISAIFLLFDLKNDTIIYADHIEHSPYTSLSTRSYTSRDIVNVERTCRIVVRAKNQRRPKANLKYNLVMKDGRTVTLYGRDEGAGFDAQVNALEYWHNKIHLQQLFETQISSTHPKEIAPTESQCASLIMYQCRHASHAQDTLLKVFDVPLIDKP